MNNKSADDALYFLIFGSILIGVATWNFFMGLGIFFLGFSLGTLIEWIIGAIILKKRENNGVQ